MTVIRITRFQTAPEDAEEMLVRRAALITAVRGAFPGLTEARLARLDERSWVDQWRWESAAAAEAAIQGAPAMAEAAAAFALAQEPTAEQAEVVDER